MNGRNNSAIHPADGDRVYRALLGPVLERGTLWATLYAAAFAVLGGALSWFWR